MKKTDDCYHTLAEMFGLDPVEVELVRKVIESQTNGEGFVDTKHILDSKVSIKLNVRSAILSLCRTLLDYNSVLLVSELQTIAFSGDETRHRLKAMEILLSYSVPRLPQQIDANIEDHANESIESLVEAINDLAEKAGFAGKLGKKGASLN